jgi:hypothetical protein
MFTDHWDIKYRRFHQAGLKTIIDTRFILQFAKKLIYGKRVSAFSKELSPFVSASVKTDQKYIAVRIISRLMSRQCNNLLIYFATGIPQQQYRCDSADILRCCM